MEVLRTIEEVFAFNLRELRGDRTQAEISEGADLPFRTYQNMEAGTVPAKKENLQKLARFHSVGETRFFLDPDLITPRVREVLTYALLRTETTKKQRELGSENINNETDELLSIFSAVENPKLRAEIVDVVKNTLRGMGLLNESQIKSKKQLGK